jgi:D-sedoheptulose 7-phosphate isomerase
MSDPTTFIIEQLQESAELLRALTKGHAEQMARMAERISAALESGKTLLLCGNGGSAADAQHFAAEMIGRLNRERPSLPAIAFTTDTSIITAVGNDYGFDAIFTRQVEGLGKKGDVLLGISTSGNSANVASALTRAKELGIVPLGLLGGDGGSIAARCDHAIIVPSSDTQRVQEAHITIIHILCALIENKLCFS